MGLYGPGGPARRRFDCVVTCFFIDTCDDLLDYFEAMDAVLEEGGEKGGEREGRRERHRKRQRQ